MNEEYFSRGTLYQVRTYQNLCNWLETGAKEISGKTEEFTY